MAKSQAQLLSDLAAIESRIQTESSKIPGLEQSEKAWRAQSLEPCNFSFKNKQEACLADRAFKKNKADTYKSLINTARSTIARLNSDKVAIEATLKAFNTTTVNLSKEGANFEAQLIESTGVADAARTTAAAKGAAEVAQAEADAQAQKQQKLLITVGAVIVVLAITVVVVIKKLKK